MIAVAMWVAEYRRLAGAKSQKPHVRSNTLPWLQAALSSPALEHHPACQRQIDRGRSECFMIRA
eukprot:1120166-Rhodomonas_salina.2